MTEPHALLGISRDASEREVKHAFRRLAMRWHPDRNRDPAALEHFKALRAAYDAMLAALAGDDGAAHDDAPAASRGADRREDLPLGFEDAFLGGIRPVEVEDVAACDACDGTGEERLRHTRLCAACHGSGRIRCDGGLSGCLRCGGRGYVATQPCVACAGSGTRRRVRAVAVRIPAGVCDGDELRVAREGGPSDAPDGVRGDLILTIVVAPHLLYARDGRDLVVTRPVSALRMLLGGDVAVPLPDGIRHVTLAPGSAAARELRIPGEGFPGRGADAPGSLVVRLVPVLPTAAEGALRELLERAERELERTRDSTMPDLANWEARWLRGST